MRLLIWLFLYSFIRKNALLDFSVNQQLQTAPCKLLHNTVLLEVCSCQSCFPSAYLGETSSCTGTLGSHPHVLQTMTLKTRSVEVRALSLCSPASLFSYFSWSWMRCAVFFPEKGKLMGRDDCKKLIDFCDIQLVPVQNGSYWYSLSTPELLLGAKGRSIKDKYSVLPCIWPLWCFLELHRCGWTIIWLFQAWYW